MKIAVVGVGAMGSVYAGLLATAGNDVWAIDPWRDPISARPRAAARGIGAAGTIALVPSDLALKTMNVVHRRVLKLSGGLVGWRTSGMPVLELTTIGRKSGRPRSVMLTSPLQEGPALVVVASRGGDDRHPAWFLNLRDNPDVEVTTKGRPKQPMRARVATADERARLWPLVAADHPNYAGYQRRTAREIPLVLLEPVD